MASRVEALYLCFVSSLVMGPTAAPGRVEHGEGVLYHQSVTYVSRCNHPYIHTYRSIEEEDVYVSVYLDRWMHVLLSREWTELQ